MTLKRVVIFGGTGLLGPYIEDAFCSGYDVTSISRSSRPYACDLTNSQDVAEVISVLNPDIVIHLVALTNVDQCQDEPDLADQINHQTVLNLVSALAPHVRLVYISTDQLYPDVSGLHAEDDVDPMNIYAQTKLAGEQAALAHQNAVALRTNLFGVSKTQGRMSLSDFFIQSFKNRTPIKIFEDSMFSPLHMKTLADLILQISETDMTGVYNLGSREGMSKADFALALADHLGLNSDCATITQSTQIGGRAPRPRDMRIDVTKIEAALGVKMPTLQEEIEKL